MTADLEKHLPINEISLLNPDLVICLEVAEHLSETRAESFIHELSLIAKTIIFSAAIIGQGGTNHINEQPHEYWHNLFEKNGFEKKEDLREIVQELENVEWWYKQNIFTYTKTDKRIKNPTRLDGILSRYRMIDIQHDFYIDKKWPSVNRLFGLYDLLQHIGANKNWKAIEIGSYAGASSELISNFVGELYCCDIWEKYITPIEKAKLIYYTFLDTKKRCGNIIEYKTESNLLSFKFEYDFFDMIYIDADHSYTSVKNDISNWFDKIKPGGIRSGHDYYMPEVKKAVDEFFGEGNITYFRDSSWSYKKPEKNNIKFSIIIPTYKRTELLKRALDSVKNQDYTNYEVLVCSDGYSEEDEKCVMSFNDDRFKYKYIEKSNVIHWGDIQRNEMIHFCTGDYVMYLDDDNNIVPDYLSYANKSIQTNVGMIIFKVRLRHVGENVIVPYFQEIKKGYIYTLNCMIRIDIAKKMEWKLIGEYGADYLFYKDCETHCLQNNIQIRYLNKIIGNHN